MISAGTERATLEVARKSLLAKARARPDQARQVLERAPARGSRSTLDLVRQRLDELGPLGYSAAGTVVEAGSEVTAASSPETGSRSPAAASPTTPSSTSSRRSSARGSPTGSPTRTPPSRRSGRSRCTAFAAAEAEVGVDRRRDRARPDRPARRPDRARRRLPGPRRRPRSAPGRARRAGRGRGACPRATSTPSVPRARADAVLICASSRRRRPGPARREARPRPGAGGGRRRRPDGPARAVPSTTRSSTCASPAPTAPAATTPTTSFTGSTTRSATCAGPSSATWRPSSTWSRAGGSGPSELVTHRFAFAEAERAFEALRGGAPGRDRALLPERRTEPRQADRAAMPSATRASDARAGRRAGKPRFGLIGAGRFATSTLIIPGLIAAGFEPGGVASASGLSAPRARAGDSASTPPPRAPRR